jgi:hypothetical protein
VAHALLHLLHSHLLDASLLYTQLVLTRRPGLIATDPALSKELQRLKKAGLIQVQLRADDADSD